MNIQRIWARGFPLFLSILFLTMLSACNLGATDEQQINVTDLPQQTQNAVQASPSPNQPTRTPSGVVVLPTPQVVATAQLPPTLSFRPPQPILPTLTALPVNVFILSPIPGNIVAGSVQVIGAAMHPEFLQYQLEYGPDPNPSNLWYPITGGVQSPVFNGLLGIWNTNTSNTPDGIYQLRLRVFLRNGVDWGNVVVSNIRIQNRIPTPVPTSTTAPRPIAAFTQDKVSGTAPLTVSFINLSSPTNLITGFTWSFGDGTTSTEISPIKTFNNPGLYTVTLTATGPGGSSNVSRQITVQSANPPVAGFTTDKTSGSAPLTVKFTDASTGGQITNYLWNFSDGSTSVERNPTHQFNNVGTYNVILTVSGPGGVSSATRQITVGNPIQASITATADTNNPLKINLSAVVSGGSGTYTAYDWDFGNGQTLMGQSTPNTSVTYASPTTYTVTLTVTDSTGAKKTVTQPVTILPPPEPLNGDFTISQTSQTDLNVGFSATATGGTGNYTYSWNFGDSTNAGSGESVSHTYGTSGTYTVILTISDGTNTKTVSKQVTIQAVQPTLAGDFTITQTSPTDLNVSVLASASGGTGNYTYSWAFGDGNTDNGQATNHAYATAGTYTITLTINDGVNSVNVVKDVTINSLPPLAGDFTITQTSSTDLNVTVSATASGGTGNYTYSWNFGDGNSNSGQSANNTYAVAGTYTITLTINDGVNSVNVVKDVTINSLPPLAGDFTITQTSPTDLNVAVSATASGGTGNYTYSWAFGDGNTDNGQATNHAYATAGTYTITLTINDGVNSVNVVKDVTINSLPPLAGDFTITQTSSTDLNVTVSATASGGTGNYTYSWNFGDGNSNSGQSANNTYAVAGTYPITLTIGDGVNTVDVVKNVTIDSIQLPPLAGDFTITQASPTDLNVSVTATASGGTGSYTYSWDFGDGSVFNGDIPANRVYTYATAGTYLITLTINDGSTTFPVTKNVTIDAVQPPPPPYASTVPILDNVGELTGDLTPIYGNGQNSGLSSSAFALVGDQTAADPNFLRAVFNLDPSMSNLAQIQATIDRFNNTGSFTRSSVGVGTLTAQDLLNVATNPSCNGSETLLQCEMRLANGSIVLVSIGYQDALNGLDTASFEAQINQLVQQSLASNVIPVLMTIQPSTNPTVNEKIDAFNEIILNVSDSARVPVINTWRALNELPNQGLTGGDMPSVDGNGAGYLSNSPTSGANARNYYTLVTLNDIVNTLFAP